MKQEPTLEQISQAWTETIECEGIAGAFSERLVALKKLRDAKYTWYGKDENDKRIALDNYLQYYKIK